MDVSRFARCFSNLAGAINQVRRRRRISHFAIENPEMLEIRVVPAAIQVVPVGSTSTTESGNTADFTVSLTTRPTKNVTIPIKSSNTAEGTVNVKQLVFTPANWATPQKFTVKGVDDAVVDGDKPYQVVLGKFKSADKSYKALLPISQNLTNIDNDVPGIRVTSANTLQTTEGAGKATFSVKLATKPTANVIVPLQSTNPLEGTVAASLTFTPTNWNQSQTVTVTGVNDSKVDGDQTYQITFGAATSSDAAYAGKTAAPITVTNVDNDVAGLTVSPKTGLTVNEGASKNVGFKLTAQPTDDVSVILTVTTGENQATLSVSTLTFTPSNWNSTQNVAINGLLGDGIDGDVTYSFDIETTSTDALFNNLPKQTVTATIHDTEAPAPNYDGTYTGTYSGSVTTFNIKSDVQGDIAATVSGNSFNMTQPFVKSGTLDGDGTVNIAVPISANPLSGITFIGTTKTNSDGTVTVSGTWTITRFGVHGSGIWSITRAPLAV